MLIFFIVCGELLAADFKNVLIFFCIALLNVVTKFNFLDFGNFNANFDIF